MDLSKIDDYVNYVHSSANFFAGKDFDIALNQHPARRCAYAEADECIARKRADPQLLELQKQYYEQQSFPRNFGLWECGIMIRRNTATMRDFCAAWLNHVAAHSHRDQISFAYEQWKQPLRIRLLDRSVVRGLIPVFPHNNPAPKTAEIK